MTYQPLFISEAIPSNSLIAIPSCDEDVDDILRLFHLHYKNALSFYEKSFFEHTDKTFGCLALNPESYSYSFMKSYDFSKITLEDDVIYIKEGDFPKMNNFRNFYCSYVTFLKFTSCYKYFIDYTCNTETPYKKINFIYFIMHYIMSVNMKVKVIND